jgi:hypothetical protein
MNGNERRYFYVTFSNIIQETIFLNCSIFYKTFYISVTYLSGFLGFKVKN